MKTFLTRRAKLIAALLVIGGIYGTTRLPRLTPDERSELARPFRFFSIALPEIGGSEMRTIRPVHPSLQHIAAWISSVGASVALADLDGDQLANDVCYVDTRTDQVVLSPVPGVNGADRFAPFALEPGTLFDRTTMAPMGCVPGDLNEDGLQDVLVYYWGRTPLAFLRRESGSESLRPLNAAQFAVVELVPGNQRWYTNAATRADVDGDGHVDIVIGNYFPDAARILDASADGTEQMHDSMSRAFNGGTNRLLLWKQAGAGQQPTVSYEEVVDAFGSIDRQPVAQGWTLAVGCADLDGDLLPEIYFGNDFGPDRLLHNRSQPGRPRFALLHGQRKLTTPKSKVLGHDSFKGMGVDFGDLNGDGQFDIYVSNIAAIYALEESHFAFVSSGPADVMGRGIAPYEEQSETLGLSRSGWGWDARLADFNNDGVLEALQATGFVRGTQNRWPELHEVAMGNDLLLHRPAAWHRFQPGDDLSGRDPNPFFVRSASGRFFDLSRELGIDQPQVSRGIATADVDGDGDLDFAVGNQWEPSRFYRNDAPGQTNQMLGLRLLLSLQPQPRTQVIVGRARTESATTPAIGAVARVRLPDQRLLVAQIDGGNGHSGTRAPEIHLGLGVVPPDQPLDVHLQWRDRTGRVHNETQQMKPGWHTVVLGDSATPQPTIAQR